jgi:hypothetical protein
MSATFMPAALRADSCEALAKLRSPTVSITFAKVIDTQIFKPTENATALSLLPAFCRIQLHTPLVSCFLQIASGTNARPASYPQP